MDDIADDRRQGGGVDESPVEAEWWDEALEVSRRVLGRQEEVEVRVDLDLAEGALLAEDWEGETPGELPVVHVVVDWMAGSQSLHKAAEHYERQQHYVGLDRQEWVYSQAMQGWVRNLKVNLAITWNEAGREKVCDMVQQEVEDREGRRVKLLWDLLGLSPDCTTFTPTDSSNITRGNNYRGHSDPERRAIPWEGPKGQLATLADQMVYLAICFVDHALRRNLNMGHTMHFYMENPVGGLARRPYMVRWERRDSFTGRRGLSCTHHRSPRSRSSRCTTVPTTTSATSRRISGRA